MNRDPVKNRLLLLVLLLIVFAGCNAPKSQLNTFGEYFRSSNYEKSIEFAQSKISNSKNPKREDLLWTLQLGKLERLRQNYRQSNNYFDRSEEMLNYFDYQNEALDSAASIAVNENIIPYLGEEYDGIMVNTYKALNFMALGDNDTARVEFNRALDRQRRAKEEFAREIEKIRNELDKEQQKQGSQVKKNVNNPEINQLINNRYPGLYEFEAYPDFVNPFTTYIAGIFFNLIGDHTKAVTFLKESYGMVRDNDYVAMDLAITEKVLDGKAKLKDTVWVIFENGLGPVKEEFRVDIPLFIASDQVKYFGIALPRLVFREQAHPYISIKADGKNYKTQIVANMDRVVQTEFSKDFKGILTRAIISATAKVVAQYALDKKDDSSPRIVSLLAAVYSYATTAADVRIWTTLPKNFQVSRLPIPTDRMITIAPADGESFQVEIPACKNALVYVRIPQKQSGQIVDLITY
jgi:hypothetical protein